MNRPTTIDYILRPGDAAQQDLLQLDAQIEYADRLIGSLPKWSTPYCDTSHLGNHGDARWATVVQRGEWADVTLWSKHVSIFQSPTFDIDSLQLAKAAAETWVLKGVMPAMRAGGTA